ncbi:hypothetical protein F5X68DRAFT_203263 [Plectosphaerella plurivora]|uniref:Uncharacterized protein n=1 Tax=Plectosphaerella plurivora TaxID=936078 RepID=A0A9P9AEX2_9PEZI|nr:hypothetical protein F5X68DRAFT_203263 [Plectosphaerella plurivora]
MASPLSPAKASTLNLPSPPSRNCLRDQYEVLAWHTEHQSSTPGAITTTGTVPRGDLDDSSASSSPFLSTVDISTRSPEKENMTPSKQRHSRIMSGNELSPLKILTTNDPTPERVASPARGSRKSILSPEKRFPIRVSNPLNDVVESPRRDSQDQSSNASSSESPQREAIGGRKVSLDDVLRDNQGLTRAIEIFEDEDSAMTDANAPEDSSYASLDDDNMSNGTQIHHDVEVPQEEYAGPDDTVMSTFSNFSSVPNMTMLARLNNSPTGRLSMLDGNNSRTRHDPSPARGRPMSYHPDSGNTTNLLMDFDTLRHPARSPNKQLISPPLRSDGSNGVPATPSRNMPNLLDFDIPPLPTPRSVPTITPRELESLKSNFLSEISSLKASLSGKEAEVMALKTAVGDAEKRVGESMEQVREMSSEKEQVTSEKDLWEKRGREMESILRSIKEEIVHSQRDREELEYKLSESEARREAAESMAQDAESKLAGMRAGKASEEGAKNKSPGTNSAKEVEMAVERVARELHALYKGKHETKVQALKKSYENRWEKRVRDLENRIEDLGEENERLRLGRDATMTRLNPQDQAAEEERKAQAIRDAAQIKEMGAEITKLEAMVRTVKDDNSELRMLLEHERVEKGELVQLAEEMMSMQSLAAAEQQTPARRREPEPQPAPAPTPAQARTPAKARTPAVSRVQMPSENGRGSTSRISGLKAPGSSIVMPGRGTGNAAAHHERTRSGHGGLPRPGSGFGPRSGIMNSIEKMGNYRGRGD